MKNFPIRRPFYLGFFAALAVSALSFVPALEVSAKNNSTYECTPVRTDQWPTQKFSLQLSSSSALLQVAENDSDEGGNIKGEAHLDTASPPADAFKDYAPYNSSSKSDISFSLLASNDAKAGNGGDVVVVTSQSDGGYYAHATCK